LERSAVILTQSKTETLQLGKRVGRLLRSGDVIAFVGELGTGKTHSIKGLAAGIGVKRAHRITSPSFALIHEYQGRIPFCHIDLFRLGGEEEAEALGLEEYFGRGGVTAIEWADKIPNLLPKELLRVELLYLGERARSIRLVGRGTRYEELIKTVSE
jgi:tRNA threonylcarbamoyladenosine biosynthesis protein TsaE